MRCVCLLLLAVSLLHAAVTYRIRLGASEGGRIVEVPAEQYVAAVLAGEASEFRNDEALKAMAVAARTYAARFRSRHAAEGFDFCSTTHCQRAILGGARGRFQKAAEETRGQLLWFHSRPALAVYSANCGGMVEAVGAVWPGEQAPYLSVHPDPYCRVSQQAHWHYEISASALARALIAVRLLAPPDLNRVIVLRRTSSGRVRTLSLAGANRSRLITASSFRFATGRTLGWNTLRSELYTVRSRDGKISFEGRGEGHGVGLCQDGADEMAAQGKTYKDILRFYYPGTSISRLAEDVEWFSVRDKQLEIFARRKGTAESALQNTKAAFDQIRARYHFDVPQLISVYVYPDLESFRNSTSEPGWIAAHTAGSRIDTQPFDILERHGGFAPVIRHELLHILIENNARPGLPLWFREGLVMCLAGTSVVRNAPSPHDAYISDREDAELTRNAYNAAAHRVGDLRTRYGTAELLRWLKEGIPSEAMRSSASSNRTNNK